MKNNTTLIIALICLSFISAFSQNSPKPQVMVLGTFHFDNPNLDVVNSQIDDVLTSKRQKEIVELVNLLKQFKPTKIAIESDFSSQKANQEYSDYLTGKYTLTRNEIDQIAYRMAKELGHKKIYPTDWQGKFEFENIIEFAKNNGEQEKLDNLMGNIKKYSDEFEKLLKTQTFRELFKKENSLESIDFAHSFYIDLMEFGKDENYVGTDVVADWYQRNLKIYTNITRIVEDKNDRILVLYGSGHSYLLRQFIKDSNKFELIEPNKFL